MYRMIHNYSLTLFVLFLISAATGCTVQFVAEYDATIKEEIVQTAKKVDKFWGSLLDHDEANRPYETFKDQYNEIESDIRGLVMKNEIRPLNKESTEQAKNTLELWVQDRELHKKNDGFSNFEAKRHREQYVRLFTAMAKGEEAKKMEAQ